MSSLSRSSAVRFVLIIGPLGLYLIRALILVDPLHATGLAGVAESGFALLIAALFLFLASSIGTAVLEKVLPTDSFNALERHLFAYSLGSGAIGAAVMVLGFLHLICGWLIIFLLSGLGALTWRSGQRWLGGCLRLLGSGCCSLRSSTRWQRLIILATLGVLFASLLDALTPSVGYDALMYHLEGARSIFERHGLFPDLDNWWNNYPFLVQMLFVAGFAFDNDVVARLTNLSFGISMIGVVFALAKRLRPRQEPWFAVACITATPPLALWASSAYIDLANATFVGLAALALVIWRGSKAASLLLHAGIMTGLALASKYTAALDAALLAVTVVWLLRSQRWQSFVHGLAYFSLPALCLAAPWYVKNWLWLGSPIFPTLLAPQGTLPLRYQLNAAYVLHGFGTGSDWTDIVSLPLQLYRSSLAFGQFALEMPSLLFAFLLLLPIAWRSISKPLLILACARLVLWAVTTQQMRFLLTTFLIASLLTSDVILALLGRVSRMGELAIRGTVLGIVLASVAAGIARISQAEPWAVSLGIESREAYLMRELAGYKSRIFVRDHLPDDARLFLVGDGRRYYCPPQCDPVVDQFGWTRVALESGLQGDRAIEGLCSEHFTHILLSWPDINYLLVHDPDGLVLDSMRLLLSDAGVGRLQPVFEEEEAAIYRLPCAG